MQNGHALGTIALDLLLVRRICIWAQAWCFCNFCCCEELRFWLCWKCLVTFLSLVALEADSEGWESARQGICRLMKTSLVEMRMVWSLDLSQKPIASKRRVMAETIKQKHQLTNESPLQRFGIRLREDGCSSDFKRWQCFPYKWTDPFWWIVHKHAKTMLCSYRIFFFHVCANELWIVRDVRVLWRHIRGLALLQHHLD